MMRVMLALDRDHLLDTLARHILYPPAKREEEVRGAKVEWNVQRGDNCGRQRRENENQRERENWQTGMKKESSGDRKKKQKEDYENNNYRFKTSSYSWKSKWRID